MFRLRFLRIIRKYIYTLLCSIVLLPTFAVDPFSFAPNDNAHKTFEFSESRYTHTGSGNDAFADLSRVWRNYQIQKNYVTDWSINAETLKNSSIIFYNNNDTALRYVPLQQELNIEHGNWHYRLSPQERAIGVLYSFEFCIDCRPGK